MRRLALSVLLAAGVLTAPATPAASAAGPDAAAAAGPVPEGAVV